MKKTLWIILMLSISIKMLAVPVSYLGCEPANESTISSFDFLLKFDISNAVADLGEGEWGLGYLGSTTNDTYTTLYKGSYSDGTVLATTCTSNFTGKSEGFSINNNTINISFPHDLKPEPGELYTLVIKNTFSIFQLGKAPAKAATSLKFVDNPLILTYIGRESSSDELILQEISIRDNDMYETISEISCTFNENIIANNIVKAQILENNIVIYESENVYINPDNAHIVCVKFPSDVKLWNGKIYNIVIPENIVTLTSDPNVGNKSFSVKIAGGMFKYYSVDSTIPNNNNVGLFGTAKILYNIPNGSSIYKEGISNNSSLLVYKDAIADSNLITTLYGNVVESNTGFQWDLTNISFEPNSEYILYRAAGLGKLYPSSEYGEWTNEESIIHFMTPSIEDSNLEPLELGVPVLGNHEKDPAFVEGQKVANITYLELALKDLKYEYNGHQNGMSIKDGAKFYVYNITSGEDVLVMEGNINDQVRETPLMYYKVASMSVFQQFFEGQKYKIVIPAGSLTVTDKLIQNYVFNQEWSIEFEGSTPTETKLNYCSLENNAELSELPVIIWEFQGDYVKNEELSAILHSTYTALGQSVESNTKRLTLVSNNLNTTKVAMVNYDSTTGKGLKLFTNNNRTYEVILPEGLIYYASDPSIKNPELRYNVIPVAATTPGVTNEFVNLEVTVNGLTTILQPAVKGESVTIKLTPNEDWAITSLTRNGDEVIELMEDGEYVTPKLTENNTIVAEISYGGTWAVETATNVWEIENGKIQIFAENNKIVVIGVTPDDDIKVFGVNGMLINSARVDNGNDRVMLSVSPGQVYIVVVDGKAAKLQM